MATTTAATTRSLPVGRQPAALAPANATNAASGSTISASGLRVMAVMAHASEKSPHATSGARSRLAKAVNSRWAVHAARVIHAAAVVCE